MTRTTHGTMSGRLVDIDYQYKVAMIYIDGDEYHKIPFYFQDGMFEDTPIDTARIRFKYKTRPDGYYEITRINEIKPTPPGFHTVDCCGLCEQGIPISVKSDKVWCAIYKLQVDEIRKCDDYKRVR